MKNKLFYYTNEQKKNHFIYWSEYKKNLYINPDLYQLNLELTKQCNEHCLHCASSCTAKLDENEITDTEIINCLKQLKEDMLKDGHKLPCIAITGGEPLLHKTFIDLVTQIHNLGFAWTLVTNGLLLTEEKVKIFKDLGLTNIALSLDGTEQTHNSFRQSPNSFQRTIKAIQNCLKHNIEQVAIFTTVHHNNIDELEDIYNILNNIGAEYWRLMPVDPCGRTNKNQSILLNSEEHKKLLDFITEKKTDTQNNIKIMYGCNHYLGLTYEGKVRPTLFYCGSGLTSASITNTGDITGCLIIERRPELTFGNIKTDNLYEVWETGFQIFRQDKSLTSTKCSKCKERERCGGSGWHTWDFSKWEPTVCMYEELNRESRGGNFSSLIRKMKERA